MLKGWVTNYSAWVSRAFTRQELETGSLLEERRRTPLLINMLVISGVSAIFLTIALGFVYAGNREPLLLAALLMAALTLFGYIGTLCYFYRYKEWLPAAHLYASTTTFSTIAPCAITGGMTATPYLPLVLIVPIFMFLMAGRKCGFFWTAVTAVCVTALFLLETAGLSLPQAVPPELMAGFRFTTWMTTLMLVLLGLISYEVNIENLTHRLAAERTQYAHEAMHDPLTGLSNRKLFYLRARDAISYAVSQDHKTAIIFIDLNDFKLVNDNFGHEVGDDVLNAVARRLESNVRAIDTIARLGGDEFAVVLTGLKEAEAAERLLNKLTAALELPLAVGDAIVRTPGSFGMAIAPDQGTTVETLLKIADKAMYRAKEEKQLSA